MNHIPGLETLVQLSGWKFVAVWALMLVVAATPAAIVYFMHLPRK